MKKKFPYFRTIQYTSDGCTAYQCLACKAKWEARSISNTFCGNCGIKFAGEHATVEKTEAEYRIENAIRKRQEEINRSNSRWVLENEIRHIYHGSKRWQKLEDYDTAKSALQSLRGYRAREVFDSAQWIEDGLGELSREGRVFRLAFRNDV